jgi:menaquinone-dependent protoporphyrinogen IX oxidase
MKNILVAYSTQNGSTKDVANAVGEELAQAGARADVARMESVTDVDRFSGVVIGAPVMLGWRPATTRFIARHLPSLQRKPIAFFMTAMRLTRFDEPACHGVPLYFDPQLQCMPRNPRRLSLPERLTTPSHYLNPVLRRCPGVIPVGVDFFGGKLDLRRLQPVQRLLVWLFLKTPPDDKRNWRAIRSWAADIRKALS